MKYYAVKNIKEQWKMGPYLSRTYQHDDNVLISMISQFLQPSFNILIGEVLSNIIDQKSTHSSTVVAEETNKLL